MTEDSIRLSAGRPATRGGKSAATRGGGLPVPIEAVVFAALTAAVLIAAAIADNFTSPSAWLYVTLLGVAYILSRGLAKREHHTDEDLL